MTLDKFLSECRERLEKATPGPWEFNVSSTTTARVWQPHHDEGLYLRRDKCADMSPDARLIANAPTDLSKLLRIVEIQAKALEWYWQHWGTNDKELKLRGYYVSKEAISDAQKIAGE